MCPFTGNNLLVICIVVGMARMLYVRNDMNTHT